MMGLHAARRRRSGVDIRNTGTIFSKSAAEQVAVRVLLDKKGIVACPVNRIPSGEPITRRIPGFEAFALVYPNRQRDLTQIQDGAGSNPAASTSGTV